MYRDHLEMVLPDGAETDYRRIDVILRPCFQEISDHESGYGGLTNHGKRQIILTLSILVKTNYILLNSIFSLLGNNRLVLEKFYK